MKGVARCLRLPSKSVGCEHKKKFKFCGSVNLVYVCRFLSELAAGSSATLKCR